MLKKIAKICQSLTHSILTTLKSPKTIALLKLGAATIALVHAFDEFTKASPGKTKIGFYEKK